MCVFLSTDGSIGKDGIATAAAAAVALTRPSQARAAAAVWWREISASRGRVVGTKPPLAASSAALSVRYQYQCKLSVV